MRIVTQNVQALPSMKQWRVKHDVQATAEAADVIVWQEIRPLRYKRAVRKLDSRLWRHAPILRDGGCPISWRRDKYQLIEAGQKQLHPGAAKVCERRAIVWVLLRERKSGALFIVHNVHYVSKGWSGRVVPDRARRVTIWEAGNTTHRELLTTWVAAGYAIFGGGDFNRRVFPVVGERVGKRKVRYADFGPDNIDHMFVINGDYWRWAPLGLSTLAERESDHHGRRIITKLIARRAK